MIPAHLALPPSPPHESRWDRLTVRSSLPLIVALTITYVVCGLLAYSQYPAAYSPLGNTLSELGNRRLNPHGAVFYLLGSGLSGVLTMAFFLTLAAWRHSGTAAENRRLTIVQILGVIAGFALIMTAIFPEDMLALHRFWSDVLFNSLGIALVVSVFALRRAGRLLPILAASAILAYTIALASMLFPEAHWLEWTNVGLCMACGYLVALRTRSLGRLARPQSVEDHCHVQRLLE